jgi:5-methylcytosine-specific restriction protein A
VALADLTDRAAVLRAIAEYDRLGADEFLKTHHFGRARQYFLIWEGRSYDSKAIAGVAHNLQRPDLPADNFSGGESTVAARLRSLGFEVETGGTGRNPPWAWDELIIALDLYLEYGMLDDRDERVIAASEFDSSTGALADDRATAGTCRQEPMNHPATRSERQIGVTLPANRGRASCLRAWAGRIPRAQPRTSLRTIPSSPAAASGRIRS